MVFSALVVSPHTETFASIHFFLTPTVRPPADATPAKGGGASNGSDSASLKEIKAELETVKAQLAASQEKEKAAANELKNAVDEARAKAEEDVRCVHVWSSSWYCTIVYRLL